MALAINERRAGGHGLVVNIDTGALVVTTITAGAIWQNGFLQDPDGRLVVVSV